MALAHAIVGARRPSQIITWTRDDGAPEDLTGATLTGKIRLYSQTTSQAIVGSLTVLNGAAGTFRWDYDDTDVETAGTHEVQIVAAYASGPTPAKTFVTEWVVKESL